MTYTVKCYLKDHVKILEEEKTIWITEILLRLGVPQNIIDLAGSDLPEFCNKMDDYGIEIDHYTSGEINVYKKAKKKDSSGSWYWLPPTQNNLIAQWKTPKFIKHREKEEVYYEIIIDEWSVNARK